MKHKYLTNPKCILFSRNPTKEKHEILCTYGNDNVTKLLLVLKEIRDTWKNVEKVYVYSENKYNIIASTIATTYILENHFVDLKVGESFPLTDVTSCPNVIPVTLKENVNDWNDIDSIAVLPGWDFYELDWILRHWEKSLGNFDFDTFLQVPSYPRDVYNKNIHPQVVFFILEQFVQKYSMTSLKEKFFGLYHFYKDSLGKKLLCFFYDCVEGKLERETIYKKLHSIYHSTCTSHPFRIYLYYLNKGLQNSSQSKKYFKIQIFISQYLSYDSMFICNNYFDQRLSMIVAGIFENYRWLQSVIEFSSLQHIENVMLTEWQQLYDTFPIDEKLTWIGKSHVQKLHKLSPFWKYIYIHWEHFNRNIFLWEKKSHKYGDSQFGTGYPIMDYFPQSWTDNFENKNFVPVENTNIRRKRKL